MKKFLFLTLALISSVAFADAPVIWSSGSLGKWLSTRGFLLNDGKEFTSQTASPISSPHAAPIGSVVTASIAGVGHFYLKTGAADSAWTDITTSSGFASIGSIDSQISADGLSAVGTALSTQTATATRVGMVSLGTQTFAGAKTFSSNVTAPVFVGATGTTANPAFSSATGSGNAGMTFDGVNGQIFVYNGAIIANYASTQWQMQKPTNLVYTSNVGSPALYLNSESTTGIYRIGANNHGYAVSGAKVLDISSTGFGVTGALSVTGAAAISGNLTFPNALQNYNIPQPTASSLGGIISSTAVSNQFVTGVTTTGAITRAQPSFTDLSGTASAAQLPNPSSSTLGGVQSAAPVSNQWINSISTSGVPSLSQPGFTNLSGALAQSQMPQPLGTSLGGVIASTAVTNQFLTGIGTTGAVTRAQPAFTDVSGSLGRNKIATATAYNIPVNCVGGDLNCELAPGSANNIIKSDGVKWVVGAAASGSGCSLLGKVIWVGTTSCTWARTSSASWADYSADTDCTTPAGGNLIGSVTAPATKVPGVTFTADSTKAYQLVASGEIISNTAAECTYRFSDGTTVTSGQPTGSHQDDVTNLNQTYLPGSSGSKTVVVQGTGNNGSADCQISAARGAGFSDFTITVYECPKSF